ncbi:hypothetical protein HORIV_41110 [Vreelandella olivaria]|uniref:Uncharacterized protein n=1 Tax=Vreelandella olivaria TaxID=390919 RepID=A0ABM7GLZ2_9GAMM|nr:hypothetical protein HORIV_41110 [Halomonas olivaria]
MQGAVGECLDKWATELNSTSSALALAWLRTLPHSPMPVIGSVKPERIDTMLNGPASLPREVWYELLEAARGTAWHKLSALKQFNKEPQMTPVIAFGEALVDMLSSRLGTATDAQETFTPYAGGAPANVAVACARRA